MTDFTRSEGLLPFTCTADWPRPDVCVVHLTGALDMATTPVVAEYLQEHTARHPAELVVDLSGVTLLAAAAVTLILDVQAGADRGRLHLVGVPGNRPVERVLELTGLRSLLDVHHDDVHALLDGLDRR